MNIKYLFDNQITEKEKNTLKAMTCNIRVLSNLSICSKPRVLSNHTICSKLKVPFANGPDKSGDFGEQQIGIYFAKNLDLKPSDAICDEIFSNCNSTFFISTDGIMEINDLSMILGFLINQTNKKYHSFEYYLFATKENDMTHINIVKYTLELFGTKRYGKVQGYSKYLNILNGTSSVTKYCTTYFIDMINDDIKTFKIQTKFVAASNIKRINYVLNLQQNANNKHLLDVSAIPICEIGAQKAKIFHHDELYYNLIDLFVDYCSKIRSEDEEQKSINLTNFESPDFIFDKTEITIVIKNNQFKINFVNADNLTNILNYIQNRFGKGDISFEVDLASNKEIIKYNCI